MTGELPGFPVGQLEERYNIKTAALYERLKFLGIKPHKHEGKAYLNQEPLEQMDQLHEHIQKTGRMEGFGGKLATSNSGGIVDTPEKAKPDIDTARKFDRAAQSRAASILVQAGNQLTAEYIADPSKLDPELRELVFSEGDLAPLNQDVIAQNLAAAIRAQLR